LKNYTKLLLLTFAFVSLILVIPVRNVQAVTGTISPSSASGLVDTPVNFKVSGLVATVIYDVQVNEAVRSTHTADGNGAFLFSITESAAGFYSVRVCNTTTNDVVATASLTVNDLISDMMPYIILFVSITILFGVVAKLKIK